MFRSRSEYWPLCVTALSSPGDESAIGVLADWLQDRDDPRALALRWTSELLIDTPGRNFPKPPKSYTACVTEMWSRRNSAALGRIYAWLCLRHAPLGEGRTAWSVMGLWPAAVRWYHAPVEYLRLWGCGLANPDGWPQYADLLKTGMADWRKFHAPFHADVRLAAALEGLTAAAVEAGQPDMVARASAATAFVRRLVDAAAWAAASPTLSGDPAGAYGDGDEPALAAPITNWCASLALYIRCPPVLGSYAVETGVK